MNEIDLNLDFSDPKPRRSKPFPIGSRKCFLQEVDPASGVAYENARARGMKIQVVGDQASTSFEGSGDALARSILVKACLYEICTDGAVRFFPSPDYDALPYRIQQELFLGAKEISGMDRPKKVEDLERRIASDTAALNAIREAERRLKDDKESLGN